MRLVWRWIVGIAQHVRGAAYSCCCAVILELAWRLVSIRTCARAVDLNGAWSASEATEVAGEATLIQGGRVEILHQQASVNRVEDLVFVRPRPRAVGWGRENGGHRRYGLRKEARHVA